MAKATANPDLLFGDVPTSSSGTVCPACNQPELRQAIDNCLLGMIDEGPFAGRVPLHISGVELWRRLHDPERTKAAGIPTYPRGESALRAHIQEHRKELWLRVQAAKRTAGY
jgi:hypothetical protein